MFLALSVFIGCMAMLMFNFAFGGRYVDATEFIMGAVYSVFALAVLQPLLNMDDIAFYGDKMVIKAPTGNVRKTLFYNAITGWCEVQVPHRYSKETVLIIYADNYKYKVSEWAFGNYDKIKKTIAGHAPQVPEKKWWTRRHARILGTVSICAALVCFSCSYKSCNSPERIMTADNTVKLTDRLLEPPVLHRYKGVTSISFRLVNYPDFEFRASGFNDVKASKFLDAMGEDDSVTIRVARDVYQRKLTRELPLRFWDKHDHYEDVEVVSAMHRDRTFATIEAYNAANRVSSAGVLF
ncbi:MAG TPA: hypothetical protein VG603_11040, partial [Chitinophagales bacterium]|nr:hypothetical protein [Chitinophagales bacterium]